MTLLEWSRRFCIGRSSCQKPTQADAEAAVKTLIEWAGDDPDRGGLIDTPTRVARFTANCSPAMRAILASISNLPFPR